MWHTVEAKQKPSRKYPSRTNPKPASPSCGGIGEDRSKFQGNPKNLAKKLRNASLVFSMSSDRLSSTSFSSLGINVNKSRKKRRGGGGDEGEDMIGMVRNVLLPSVSQRVFRFLCDTHKRGYPIVEHSGAVPLGRKPCDSSQKCVPPLDSVEPLVEHHYDMGNAEREVRMASEGVEQRTQKEDQEKRQEHSQEENTSLGELVTSPCLRSTSNQSNSGEISILLYGLGIGAFHPEESKASFLQMAAFVALQQKCLAAIQMWNKEMFSDCSRESVGPGVRLRTFFFDPCTSSFHWNCCTLLGMEVEQQNKMGWYRASVQDGDNRRTDHSTAERTLLIVYAPHCPWPLLHNLFAANWPGKATVGKDEKFALPHNGLVEEGKEMQSGPHHHLVLHDLHVVGNDPRIAPLDTSDRIASSRKSKNKLCVFHPEFVSLLTIASPGAENDPNVGNINDTSNGISVKSDDKWKCGECSNTPRQISSLHQTNAPRNEMTREEVEEEALSNGGTFGVNISTDDLFQAFYGTASYCVRKDQTRDQLMTQLGRISAKTPVRITNSSELR